MISNQERYHQYMYSYPHKTAYRQLARPVPLAAVAAALADCSELYLHIPFCSSKCGFCNLFSVAGSTELLEDYIDAVAKQAESIAQVAVPRPKSFTVGGGTPLVLSAGQLERLFTSVQEAFSLDLKSLQSCIETSPKETSPEKLDILKAYQIQRISLGVQSFWPEELAALKRHHTLQDVERALGLLKHYNFPLLNLDLIYGIPGQTRETWRYSLAKAVDYTPGELFIYPLYIREHKTLDWHQPEMAPFYELARDFLIANGYEQKSMRRFSKDGGKSVSCGFENMLALGCGGRSYLGGFHTCVPYSDRSAYIRQSIADFIAAPAIRAFTHGIHLSQEEQSRRFVMKNLFVAAGVSLLEYAESFAAELLMDFPRLLEWEAAGYVYREEGKLKLTTAGMGLSDYLAPQLISQEVARLSEKWCDPWRT